MHTLRKRLKKRLWVYTLKLTSAKYKEIKKYVTYIGSHIYFIIIEIINYEDEGGGLHLFE